MFEQHISPIFSSFKESSKYHDQSRQLYDVLSQMAGKWKLLWFRGKYLEVCLWHFAGRCWQSDGEILIPASRVLLARNVGEEGVIRWELGARWTGKMMWCQSLQKLVWFLESFKLFKEQIKLMFFSYIWHFSGDIFLFVDNVWVLDLFSV